MTQISRRDFNACLAGSIAGLAIGWPSRVDAAEDLPATFEELEVYIEAHSDPRRIAGLSACCFSASEILWSTAHGWADVGRRIPMTPHHILNIASISKTVTGCAVMQLVESGKIDLDADVNTYLPIAVVNPRYPDAAISVRQLLTHTSSIKDGPAYDGSYTCGDPTVSLASWIEGYFNPEGIYYDRDGNFLPSPPGTTHEYSNVGYGLLGFLVETLSGRNFSDYCRNSIFNPLGMTNTGWYISEIDRDTHATPHRFITQAIIDTQKNNPLFVTPPESRGMAPLCLYSFPNYPDGSLRTSPPQLARFGMAFLNGGHPLLRPETVQRIFSVHWEYSDEPDRSQGLTWYHSTTGESVSQWSHSGGDPGVSTLMVLRPESRTGAIVLCNSGGSRLISETVHAALDIAGSHTA